MNTGDYDGNVMTMIKKMNIMMMMMIIFHSRRNYVCFKPLYSWRLRISDFVNSTSQSLYIGLSYVYKFWVESKRHVRLTWESLGKIPEKRIL